ncbi:MAG: hypothetical protein AB7E96_10425 [Deferribacterales bacterium]
MSGIRCPYCGTEASEGDVKCEGCQADITYRVPKHLYAVLFAFDIFLTVYVVRNITVKGPLVNLCALGLFVLIFIFGAYYFKKHHVGEPEFKSKE